MLKGQGSCGDDSLLPKADSGGKDRRARQRGSMGAQGAEWLGWYKKACKKGGGGSRDSTIEHVEMTTPAGDVISGGVKN